MAKVILNKSIKIEGKGLVLAGVEIDVTAKEKKALDEAGFIGKAKDPMPTNEKEIRELQAKVTDLEKQVEDGSSEKVKELEAKVAELESDKTELEAKVAELTK